MNGEHKSDSRELDGPEYWLGYWSQPAAESADEVRLQMFPTQRIDRETFERYRSSAVPLSRMTDRRSFILLEQAMRNLRETVQLRANIRAAGGRYIGQDVYRLTRSLSGAVTDWLSWTYVYLGNEKTFFTRLGDEELRRFEDATHRAYDEYPAYRFMYALRSYAHHDQPPVVELNVSAREDGGTEVALIMNKQQLLESRQWTAKERAVLDPLPNKISVLPLVEEAMQGFRLIEDELLAMHLEYAATWLATAQEALEALGQHEGHPCLFVMPPETLQGLLTVNDQIGTAPLLSREQLDQIRNAIEHEDPVAAIRTIHPTTRGFTADKPSRLKATEVMAAVVTGDHAGAMQLVWETVQADQDPSNLIVGLMDLNQQSLHLLALTYHAAPERFLNTDWQGLLQE